MTCGRDAVTTPLAEAWNGAWNRDSRARLSDAERALEAPTRAHPAWLAPGGTGARDLPWVAEAADHDHSDGLTKCLALGRLQLSTCRPATRWTEAGVPSGKRRSL